MLNKKTSQSSHIVSRRLVMPDEINTNGALFGGVLMSWIDMTGYMCAGRHAETSRVVTASIDRIEFLRPLRMGDHVLLTARVEYVGRTSMAVEVVVEKESLKAAQKENVATAQITFVALNEQGVPMPVPPLALTSEEEIRRSEIARMRGKVQQRYRKWREKKTRPRDEAKGGHSDPG